MHQYDYMRSEEARTQNPKDRIARARSRHQQQMLHFKRILDDENQAPSPARTHMSYVSGTGSSAVVSSLRIDVPPPATNLLTGQQTNTYTTTHAPVSPNVPPQEPQRRPLEQGQQWQLHQHQPPPPPQQEQPAQAMSPLTTVPSPAEIPRPTGARSLGGAYATIGVPRPMSSSTTFRPVNSMVYGNSWMPPPPAIQQDGFTPGMLSTLTSQVKDHIILRQQEQIHELSLQNKEARGAVNSMIAEFTSIQSQDQVSEDEPLQVGRSCVFLIRSQSDAPKSYSKTFSHESRAWCNSCKNCRVN